MMTGENGESQIKRILASPKASFKAGTLRRMIRASETEGRRPPLLPVLIQISDMERFQSNAGFEFKIRPVRNDGNETDPLAGEMVVYPDGFPVPFARTRVTPDQLESLLSTPGVDMIEADIKITALNGAKEV